MVEGLEIDVTFEVGKRDCVTKIHDDFTCADEHATKKIEIFSITIGEFVQVSASKDTRPKALPCSEEWLGVAVDIHGSDDAEVTQ